VTLRSQWAAVASTLKPVPSGGDHASTPPPLLMALQKEHHMNIGKDKGVIVIEPISEPLSVPREGRVPAPSRQ